MSYKNRADYIAYHARYREANRERQRLDTAARRAANPGMHAAEEAARRRANPARFMLNDARKRALQTGREFNLELSDIVVPTHCPVLGTAIEVGKKSRGPSLDRIDNNRGYVKGNVVVVSLRANRIKNDASVEELRAVADFYGSIGA